MLEAKREAFIKLANAKMPFGKFKGRFLIDLPEEYLLWFKNQGMPQGQLGDHMTQILDIKINGLEHLIRPFIEEK